MGDNEKRELGRADQEPPRVTIAPRFRDQNANYVFEVDEQGSIVRVLYPSGEPALRRTEAD